jgi:hypothetical protein
MGLAVRAVCPWQEACKNVMLLILVKRVSKVGRNVFRLSTPELCNQKEVFLLVIFHSPSSSGAREAQAKKKIGINVRECAYS